MTPEDRVYSERMNRRPPSEELLAKERAVLELRRKGMTFDHIAQELGYASAGGAKTAYDRVMLRGVREDVAAERERMADQLDMLVGGHWDRAMAGNADATTAVLRIFDRRAKLMGLDMPIRFEVGVTVWDADASAIDRELMELYEQFRADAGGDSDALGEAESVPGVLGSQEG